MPRLSKRPMMKKADHMSSKKRRASSSDQQQHAMAVRIQQRFWYARARWNTRRRMAQKLLGLGLDIRRPDQAERMVSTLMAPNTITLFASWLGRLVRNRLPDLQQAIAPVLNVFFVGVFKYSCVDPEAPHSEALVRSSEGLLKHIDECLHGNYAVLRNNRMLRLLKGYIAIYARWKAANETSTQRKFLQIMVKEAFDGLNVRRRSPSDERLSGLINGSGLYRTFADTAPEVKTVLSLPKSRFWGSHGLTLFRFMHELLINEAFVLHRPTVLPGLRYDSTLLAFLIDLRAVIMYPARDEVLLTDMAQAMGFEEEGVLDVARIAERLIPLMCRVAPAASNTIQAMWANVQSRSDTIAVTNFLTEAAREVRYVLACADVELCRLGVQRHAAGFHPTRTSLAISRHTKTKRTEAWIQRMLRLTASDDLLVRRLAQGDPFALLKFHDHSIIKYVLSGECVGDAKVPEVLLFDLERMHAVYASLVLRKPELVFRMVDSGEVPFDTEPSVKQAVCVLRDIVFVCRFQHGECIADLTQRIAKRMVLLVDSETTLLQ